MVSAYSIGTGQRSTNWKSGSYYVPGPGNYNPYKMHKITPPQWKIGTGARVGFNKNLVPGPGSYDPDKNKPSGIQYPFGLKTSYNNTKNDNPGPGSYTQQAKVENTTGKQNPFNYNLSVEKSPPKYSMGAKTGSQFGASGKNMPGPGAYNQNKSTLLDVPSTRIGSAKRNELYIKNSAPGVGSYNLNNVNSAPKFGFGTSQRDNFPSSFKYNPGPGAYNLSTSLNIQKGKGFSITSRQNNNDQKALSRQPGPGQYDPKQIPGKQAVRIGSAKRDDHNHSRNQMPGPGSYFSNYQYNRPNSPSYRIGNESRRPLSATINNPGPGSYEIPNKLIEGPKYGMHGFKGDIMDISKSKYQPGPGQYDPDYKFLSYKEKGSAPSIGTSQRYDFTKGQKMVGPGQYDVRQGLEGPKWGFGTSNRQPLNSNDGQPGPGTYNIPPKFNDVPKYLLPNKSYY